MHFKKGALAILLVLAMVTVAFAAILPVAAAEPEPEPEEIPGPGYQTSVNFAVGRATTEMRFVSTIGSLDYTKAGFVFSFEKHGGVRNPEIGADGCYKVEAKAAYKTIYADGKAEPAPEGRWWIAAKVINIPQTEYNNEIYVRAFVTDGEGTRYSVTTTIEPFRANREDGAIREYKGTSSKKTYGDQRNVWTDVLQSGAKTFCPTQENPAGNDLYIEYSILFSKYLTDTYLKASSTAPPNVTSGVAQGSSMEKELIYWDPCDSKTDYGFKAVYNFTTLASEDPGLYPNIAAGGLENSPHVGGADLDHPEYGWHRIGIRYHEEVTNVEDVKGGLPAKYYLTVSLYIDGDLVSVLCAEDNMVDAYDLKLYTAVHDGNNGIVYTDVANTNRDQSVYVYLLMNYRYVDSSHVSYCVFADCYATCGKSFVQQVERVDEPVEFIYTTSDVKGITSPVYYRITN